MQLKGCTGTCDRNSFMRRNLLRCCVNRAKRIEQAKPDPEAGKVLLTDRNIEEMTEWHNRCSVTQLKIRTPA